MDKATWLGIVLGVGAIMGGLLLERGSLSQVMQPTAAMYSTSQVDKRRVGQLALAIQVAFQQLGVFPASTTQVPVNSKEPMPFSAVQAVENSERTAELGRIVPSPTSSLSGAGENGDLTDLRRELEQSLASQIARHEVALRRFQTG